LQSNNVVAEALDKPLEWAIDYNHSAEDSYQWD